MLRLLVGALMVLKVSGDEEVDVMGYLGESVLLPCTCLDRDEHAEFKWQKGQEALLFMNPNFGKNYNGRAEVFLNNNSSNCSIRLNNITVDDQGQYICIFHKKGIYTRMFVNLNVSATYTIRQHTPLTLPGGGRVFQCDVKGRYRETEIVWMLDGEPILNSSTTTVHTTDTLEDSTGYNFKSKLTINGGQTSEPTCNVTAKGITAAVISGPFPTSSSPPPVPSPNHHLWIIPIVCVLMLSLVLYFVYKRTRRFTANMREVETEDF
ncbi:selection and upkeep of intraepithelial T-cells protein 4 [Mugil cephalus]|uniref:selection and upkeep of intraepithelial T-cells protein 4 n=1 Tax=Mugil cephalus TaxID=48193 RepID=UPI001FB62B97|nr:selection and upkeep of intraepithelial T-cells protein 4 [Mugil cephalus]